jgi:hypothetical protein
MQKKPKALVLAKETLRRLDSGKLEEVAGGDFEHNRPSTSMFIVCWTSLNC